MKIKINFGKWINRQCVKWPALVLLPLIAGALALLVIFAGAFEFGRMLVHVMFGR